MDIVNMNALTEKQICKAAQILADVLWPSFEEAAKEIRERLIPENTLLAAVEDGCVLGWGGILPLYGSNVFELHPLAVAKEIQKKGIGTALLRALEDAARERGGITMWLGADDETDETSFSNVDLYDDLPNRILHFQPNTHQTAFYLKNGYTIIGVVPDANGLGKPDIIMGKRL